MKTKKRILVILLSILIVVFNTVAYIQAGTWSTIVLDDSNYFANFFQEQSQSIVMKIRTLHTVETIYIMHILTVVVGIMIQ